MRNGVPVLLGSGRYIQNEGALSLIGSETAQYGKKALILAGKTAWSVAEEKIKESLEKSGIDFTLFIFDGYCSEPYTDKIAATAKECGAEIVIGVGGGKVLDAAKWAANKIPVRCICIPTSCATCSAYVSLCVVYDDTGSVIKPAYINNEVAAVLVDTDLIARNSPPRLFAAGIADALAKFPEMEFSMSHATNWERSILPRMGVMLSKFNLDIYFDKGLEALESVKQKKVTPVMEDILCTNLVLTGLISLLASGGKQIAIAHAIYDCTAAKFKAQRNQYLHGEIVACALPVQMGINGYDEAEITKMREFLKSLGIPLKLADMGIEPSKENLKVFTDYIFTSMEITDPDLKKRIEDNIGRIA